jgi:hypothetical protein
MTTELRQRFLDLWAAHFPGADLPIAWFYSDTSAGAAPVRAPFASRCMIGELTRVRAGEALCFDKAGLACTGARRYLGYQQTLRPNFEYFLSCGLEGVIEGERYKKSPALVTALLEQQPAVEAPAPYIVFKRWDALTDDDEPAVILFFATPDVLAGLFTLVNFDMPSLHGVIAPMGSGCSSIVYHPLRERQAEQPRAVLGMFDVSARPEVPADRLTLAIPMPLFLRMIDNADESFLRTEAWGKVRERLHVTRHT